VLGDPLAELAATGGLAVPSDRALAELRELATWGASEAPGLRTIVASAVPYHDAGMTIPDEVAVALATAVEYARAVCDDTLDLAAFSRALVLRFGLGPDVVLELAKLRAARWLWGAVAAHLGDREGGRNVRIAARTSWRHEARVDPWVNVLRATTGALAGALAGIDVLAVQPLDDLDDAPQERTRRWALGIQHLLREEAGLDAVVDPAGGSFAIESLSDGIARAAWSRVREIESTGGMLAALREGRVQAWAAAGAGARVAEAQRAGILGVTKHPPARPTWTFCASAPRAGATRAEPVERVAPLVPARLSAPFEEPSR
jgi:methylmalonyl-CoA mutase